MELDVGAESLAYVEALYEEYLKSPGTISPAWRRYFEDLEDKETHAPGQPIRVTIGREQLRDERGPGGERCDACGRAPAMSALQARVDDMIRAFRAFGHLAARLDPLGAEPPRVPALLLETYGFTAADARIAFQAGALGAGGSLSLAGIVSRLHATYCGHIGPEIAHVDDPEARAWLEGRMERSLNRTALSREKQVRILERLTDAVVFERFVQTKFTGAKSFSLEGAESFIPLLDLAVEKAAALGVREVALGMPHRGRLNVLANVLGKDPRRIFEEFIDDPDAASSRGDVKYHLGHHRDVATSSGAIVHVDLSFNPSHLEFVGPVVLGRLRAKLDRTGGTGLAILVHGDAAFAGEGIVQETLNISALRAYGVGGALHVIVNNGIGFTTPPEESRSTRYASDVAKSVGAPVFHVNGENPEAVAQAVDLALEYRERFRRDAVIDMYCYRLRGHNEGDEPAFTQPVLYAAIRTRRGIEEAYRDHLLALGELGAGETEAITRSRRERLEREYEAALSKVESPAPPRILGPIWDRYRGGPLVDDGVATGLSSDLLGALLERVAQVPAGFSPHPKIEKLLSARGAMSRGGAPLDWAAGEALAIASLAHEGFRVRLVGQDSERGTFSHRHAVLHDVATDERHEIFAHLHADQAPVEVRNSPLSEAAALGFEYGYSLARPDGLVVWEAQFGDFANAAQVMIDQFVASAEAKWGLLSGLVLLLPHGLEGTGPEHASARPERFLELSARDNWRVAQPTTPAQFFHLLRRQVLSPHRVPLVVMAPKSLLRHSRAVSAFSEMAEGTRFRKILVDSDGDPASVRRALLCSGKVAYDLLTEVERRGAGGVAVARLEQLYPLDEAEIFGNLEAFPDLAEVVFVQEEPANMGALPYLARRFGAALAGRYSVREVCREASPSPATGSAARHRREQAEIVARAFG